MVVNLMKMNSCNMTIKTIVVIKIITLIEGAVYNLLFLNHCLYELQINSNSNNFDEVYNLVLLVKVIPKRSLANGEYKIYEHFVLIPIMIMMEQQPVSAA